LTSAARRNHATLSPPAIPAEREKIMSQTDDSSHDPWLADYDGHLQRVLGAAPATRQRYGTTVRRFLRFCFGTGTPDWAALSVETVVDFIRREAATKTGHGRSAPAVAVRSFLRFLAVRGVVPTGLDRAIPTVRRWRHASLPPRLSDVQVDQLIAAAGVGPAARRDRAILLLLARLGLRADEVVRLDLDDLDWHNGLVHLSAGKGRRGRVLPLPREVGAALADYLRHDRPAAQSRRVFLTATPAAQPLGGPAAISILVKRRLARAGVPVAGRIGAHLLRHTAASRMANRGASFKDIADVLGHRSLQTTALYAKLDLGTLAAVALPWIGGTP
jgi:site-specific recombinase XerD